MKKAAVLVSLTDSLNMELDSVKYLSILLRYLEDSLVCTRILFLLSDVSAKPKRNEHKALEQLQQIIPQI